MSDIREKLAITEFNINTNNKVESIKNAVDNHIKDKLNNLRDRAAQGSAKDIVMYNILAKNQGKIRLKVASDILEISDNLVCLDEIVI